jgi:hypothetical protein
MPVTRLKTAASALIVAVATGLLVGCGSGQRGYVHTEKQFTADDRWLVDRIRASPLGKPELMRAVVDSMLTEKGPLEDCDYSVTKRIDRNGVKDNDGTYPVHYVIECVTSVGNDPELRFEWVFDSGGFGITAFSWGWDYSDLPDSR